MASQLLFILGGLSATGFGVYEIILQSRLRREGIRVQGVVVRHVTSRFSESSSRHAVVRFVDMQGRSHEYRSALSGTGKLPVGREVPVLYLSGAPKKARVDIRSRRWSEVATPTLFGMVFTAVGIFWMVSSAGPAQ